MARSRRPKGVERSGVSSSRDISCSARCAGSFFSRFGVPTSAAGSSSIRPSRRRYRKNVRNDASFRAAEARELPRRCRSARKPLTAVASRSVARRSVPGFLRAAARYATNCSRSLSYARAVWGDALTLCRRYSENSFRSLRKVAVGSCILSARGAPPPLARARRRGLRPRSPPAPRAGRRRSRRPTRANRRAHARKSPDCARASFAAHPAEAR